MIYSMLEVFGATFGKTVEFSRPKSNVPLRQIKGAHADISERVLRCSTVRNVRCSQLTQLTQDHGLGNSGCRQCAASEDGTNVREGKWWLNSVHNIASDVSLYYVGEDLSRRWGLLHL